MRISVILSTYNQPHWLEKSIWGYAVQSHRDFELLVADDGSTDDTRQAIDRLKHEAGLKIKHVWHEDRGFRKCAILNAAIAEASGDYLVFSDGDCIPRWDFLSTHAQHARSGFFLSGGYFKLPLELSRKINSDDIVHRRATSAVWLRSHGLRWSPKLLKVSAGPRLSKLLDVVTTTKATWNGHNASGWKADLAGVNGFDERMEWGGEDREMGERLMNLGIRGKRIRYQAICVHLDHARGYVRQDALERNLEIRRQTRATRATWTAYGMTKTQQRMAAKAA
jgi:glycosyltransferase involved in cell wall biosynthesis